MQYAKLTKLGGVQISAQDADYEDYKGFLKCLECSEPVFLRKAHKRKPKGISNTEQVEVEAAFVHHKAVPEVSVCIDRVGRYTKEDVEAARNASKNQRLQRLIVSLWKMLKTTLSIDLKNWSALVQDVKKNSFLNEVVGYALDILDKNQEFILESTFSRVAELIKEKDPAIGITPEAEAMVNSFLKARSRSWELHCQISKEALELFLKSSAMKEIRYRLCCCLAHPKSLEAIPELLDWDTATPEWRSRFVAHITLYVTFVFLMVDWIEIFDK